MHKKLNHYTKQLREVDRLKHKPIDNPYGTIVEYIHAQPLRKINGFVHPLKNVNIAHSEYKGIHMFRIDNATTLLIFPDRFSCIYDTADMEYLCEFIDTIDGSIDYDDDDENGNINALHTAWYQNGGMVSW